MNSTMTSVGSWYVILLDITHPHELKHKSKESLAIVLRGEKTKESLASSLWGTETRRHDDQKETPIH